MAERRANIPEQRRRRIAELVRGSGGVAVADIEREFGVSPATARRDLAVLEGLGKVRRTHGGAVVPGVAQHEDSFQQRLGEAVEAKGRIARAVASLLEPEETVFVDSSTTAYYAARRVLADASSGVTCLTNLVPVMDLFSTADPTSAGMVGIGGIFRPLTLSFVGPCAVRTIESYLADRAFVGVKGITPEGHLTDANPMEAEVKRAMIRQADKPVVLVDGRKFERRGLSVIAHLSEVSMVMTADARPSHVEALEDMGVAVKSV